MILVLSLVLPGAYADPASCSVGLGAVSVMTIKGLPTDKAVQQFAFSRENDTEYLYATQRIKTTPYLSRAQISTDGKTAQVLDYAVLSDFGHGESMEVGTHNGQTYVYLINHANPLNNYAWGTTVSRLKYNAGEISDIRTITGMEFATPDGSIIRENAASYRINFALDEEADLIAFYIRTADMGTTKNVAHVIAAYSLSGINRLLDEADTVSLKDCTALLDATTGPQAVTDICFNSSFQGLEVTPQGQFLLTGGSVKVKPQLSIFSREKDVITRSDDILNVDSVTFANQNTADWSTAADKCETNTFMEIESIKYWQGEYYVSFKPLIQADCQNCTQIYRLSPNPMTISLP